MTLPTPPERDHRILTPAEVARLFRVDPKTVTKWANAGKLRSFRTLGGQRRFYATEIEQHLQGQDRTR
jgi:excisionase family DNA binding protein